MNNFYIILKNIFKDFYLINKINSFFLKNLNYFFLLEKINIEKKYEKVLLEELKTYKKYKLFNFKKIFENINSFNIFILIIDYIWVYIFSRKYALNKNSFFRSYFRIESTKNGFYFNFKKLNNNKQIFNKHLLNTFLSGYKYIWLGVRFWIFPAIILFTIIYFTLVLRALPFNKIIFSWICILMFIYWLISGFVFFIKKYQFGKYTTSVQRFWRRSYILFWMIEGGTFLVFMYFTFNSSQESFYMYDQISIFKTHLYSWKYFLLKIFPLIILIVSTYLLMISIKWNIFNKNSLILLMLTFFISYIVWLEFYQFFHVLNFYGNLNWIYDLDEHIWSLELEPRRTRIVNHYVMLLFILKFWHIVFIYAFWIFFVLRCWETKRIRYPLLSANFQNFIILYIFAWVFMYPWIKFYLRKFLDIPYYWFYINNRKIFYRVFFNDLKLIYYGLLNNNKNYFLNYFLNNNFYYWKISSLNNNFEIYRKFVIKDRIVLSLINLK